MRFLLPASLRRKLRRNFDRCFCRSGLNLSRIGQGAAWTVLVSRLGPDSSVLSGGAGNDISFELELASRFGCRVAVFDPSPTGCATFDAVSVPPAGLTFHKQGLAGSNQTLTFDPPADAAEGSFVLPSANRGAVEFSCVSPEDALRAANLGQIELLKIDIEGFEYEFLEKMLEQGIRPSQIAVEFHHFQPHVPLRRSLSILWRLRNEGYVIAHKEQCDFLLVHKSALHS